MSALNSLSTILERMDTAKAALDSCLSEVTDAQKDAPSTATKWAIRDHLSHLAVWQHALLAILDKRDRYAAMGIDRAWLKDGVTNFDDINAMIYYQHKVKTHDEALAMFEASHQAVRAALAKLDDATLALPFHHFQAGETHDTPIVHWVEGATYKHYEQHLMWMSEPEKPHITINHVAVVVETVEGVLPFWRDALGLPMGEVRDVPQEQVKVAFLEAGEAHVELVQPTTAESGIAAYLAKKGAGMHHICFEVDDIAAALAHMQAQGIALINDTPKERDGRKYAFIHPKSTGGVLVELYERL